MKVVSSDWEFIRIAKSHLSAGLIFLYQARPSYKISKGLQSWEFITLAESHLSFFQECTVTNPAM